MSLIAHRIRRLTWLVRTPSASSAFAQRQALRTELESVLLPTLERAFDKYASSDQVLRIPKLTLHVATDCSTVADLARRIEEQLARGIEEQLPVLPRASIPRPAARHGVPRDTLPEGRPNVRHLSSSEHRRDLLIEYLRSGRVGWPATTHETSELVEWLRAEAERFVTEHPRGESILMGTLETRVAMSFRLLQLLPPATRDTLLRCVSPPREELIAALVQSARNLALGNYWQLRVAALLFALRDEDLPDIRARSVVEVLAAWSLPLAAVGISAASLARIVDARGARMASPAAAADVPSAASPRRAPAAQQPDSSSEDQRLINVIPEPRASPAIDDEVAWRVMPVDPPAAADVPGLLTCDAGLILLHPFLPRLFEATGIAATTSRRLTAESLPRAAAFLHWLATGRETVFEFELALCKVLLGLTPDDPLAVSDGLLSPGDRDEGDALLAAVIDHWSALRQTSVAGLRASFLQRHGMLRDDEHGWRLRMETESFDLLLGQLPWSITVVKLPWMTKPIFTDWPTP